MIHCKWYHAKVADINHDSLIAANGHLKETENVQEPTNKVLMSKNQRLKMPQTEMMKQG